MTNREPRERERNGLYTAHGALPYNTILEKNEKTGTFYRFSLGAQTYAPSIQIYIHIQHCSGASAAKEHVRASLQNFRHSRAALLFFSSQYSACTEARTLAFTGSSRASIYRDCREKTFSLSLLDFLALTPVLLWRVVISFLRAPSRLLSFNSARVLLFDVARDMYSEIAFSQIRP